MGVLCYSVQSTGRSSALPDEISLADHSPVVKLFLFGRDHAAGRAGKDFFSPTVPVTVKLALAAPTT